MDQRRGRARRWAPHLSEMRGIYLRRLAARCVIAAAGTALLLRDPSQAGILEGWAFFRRLSPFQILWAVWILDIVWQMVPRPIPGVRLALGSQKLFRSRFRPADGPTDPSALRRYVLGRTRAACRVLLLWTLLVAALWRLKDAGRIGGRGLLIVSLIFYVCDLICVLIWCPFRLIVGARCCTTCRIFNWDHLMMFTPMLPIRGFFSISLIVLSAAAWLVWEICVLRWPERFWEGSNAALRCDHCTDRLCIQYCERALF